MESKLTIKKIFPLLLLCIAACTPSSNENSDKNITAQDMDINDQGLSDISAVIKTVHGEIIFKFYPQKAPNTVTRIIQLIQSGHYDGKQFHKVVTGTIIQGGGGANGIGSSKKIKAEFNNIKHILGTIGIFHENSDDSGDSTFYITLKDLPLLDGKYTVFGQIIAGQKILSKITAGEKMISVSIKNQQQMPQKFGSKKSTISSITP